MYFSELTGLTQIQALTYNSLIELAISEVTSSLVDSSIVPKNYDKLHFSCASIAFYKYALLINCVTSINPTVSAMTTSDRRGLVDIAEKIKQGAYLAVNGFLRDNSFYAGGIYS